MDNGFKFFANHQCRYYPCHEMTDNNEMAGNNELNCLFCFCPLYFMGDKCGGRFKYNDNGVKDCHSCDLPHTLEGYDIVILKLKEWSW
jgi:Zn-finger protein